MGTRRVPKKVAKNAFVCQIMDAVLLRCTINKKSSRGDPLRDPPENSPGPKPTPHSCWEPAPSGGPHSLWFAQRGIRPIHDQPRGGGQSALEFLGRQSPSSLQGSLPMGRNLPQTGFLVPPSAFLRLLYLDQCANLGTPVKAAVSSPSTQAVSPQI